MTSESAEQYRDSSELSEHEIIRRDEQIIKNAVIRLNGHILGFVIGVLGFAALFIATIWLVLKGGEVVGPHLGLLGNYLPGYSVTVVGSFIGGLYAFVLGYVAGLLIGGVYNMVVWFRSSK